MRRSASTLRTVWLALAVFILAVASTWFRARGTHRSFGTDIAIEGAVLVVIIVVSIVVGGRDGSKQS